MAEANIKIQIINGPNLNMLGQREPEKYGRDTLATIEAEVASFAESMGMMVTFFQSNSESAIVEKVQSLVSSPCDGVVINPAAYTHTSVAIRDALLLLDIPIIEVHLSNIFKREPFRQTSLVTDIATGQIAGFGKTGYLMALQAMKTLISEKG
jgi:3-dehydroquinate dehydratase II